jgi:nicotinate phosphoribosyltransferase
MTSDPGQRGSRSLLTDLYELTMAEGFLAAGRAEDEAVFHLFFRTLPFGGGYAIACGLADAIAYLDGLRFEAEDLAYLAGLRGADDRPLFSQGFLRKLETLQLRLDVDAVPEGTLVFGQEPLVRVRGPLLEAQMVETALLNAINFPTLIATKAARVCQAAGGDPVLEFGLRRAHGPDGALTASRAAFVGGCAATSNVLAGLRFGIPVRGTHAHSWVMAFDSELEAFRAYAEALPHNTVFLVDTYDSLDGVRHAIEVGQELRRRGFRLGGVRLDSGDLAWLSIEARKLLDAAGFTDTVIVASNDLDEHLIESLKRQGAKVAVWGVGTKLVTAYDQPALGGVYKLTAIRREGARAWSGRIKLSEQIAKVSVPGVLQVRRFADPASGMMVADVIFDESAPPAGAVTLVDWRDHTRRRTLAADLAGSDLLVPVFRGGRRVYDPPSPAEARARTLAQLERLGPWSRRLQNPHEYPVGLEAGLAERRQHLVAHARAARETGARKRALILVDIQNDFCPGGALAVPRGDEVVPVANRLVVSFPLVVATQDWHPADHGSFAAHHPGRKPYELGELAGTPQVLWPAHCVQGTPGAAFHRDLDVSRVHRVFQKGTDRDIDSYSAFHDNGRRRSTGLADFLRAEGVGEVFLLGLATEFCVRATALDARLHGFDVTVIEDGCRAVELAPGDGKRAVEEMRRAGARVVHSRDVA